MAYIIDGHNLIGILPDIQLSQPDDEARLVERLLSYRAHGGGEMMVFFDSNPFVSSIALPQHRRSIPSRPGMDVRYASGDQSADDAIVDFLQASRQPGQYAVVTNDLSLTARVRSLGASVLSASEFSAQMARSKPKKRGSTSLATASAPNPHDPAFADLYDEFLAAEKAPAAGAQPPDTAAWIERLYTGDEQLQLQAARVLGRSRAPEAGGPLRDALTSKDAALRAEAALSLGLLRSRPAVPDLVRLLSSDGNGMVREAAAQALGNVGSAKAAPALETAAAEDTKSKVRKAARAALASIRARQS